jgi:hypothetical protein
MYLLLVVQTGHTPIQSVWEQVSFARSNKKTREGESRSRKMKESNLDNSNNDPTTTAKTGKTCRGNRSDPIPGGESSRFEGRKFNRYRTDGKRTSTRV